MKACGYVVLVVLTACPAAVWGQDRREPHIGYLYPGGGQQGSVVQIIVGGQFLRGANNGYISGEGVRARVIEYYRPVRNIQKEQREELMQRLRQVREKRIAELPERDRAAISLGDRFDQFPGKQFEKRAADRIKSETGTDKPKPLNEKEAAETNDAAPISSAPEKEAATETAPFRPVEHPLLYDLENKSLRELHHVMYHLFFSRQKKQMNAQIDEMALMEVTIAPDAAPGDRELRLETPLGLTNPMVFQVGQVPEVCELEPNDPRPHVNPNLPGEPPLDLPVLLNGQIMPGDVDRFRFRARKGQQLVIEVHARRLVPFLADAVPGWFQATLALYDAKGSEAAFADDYRFHPDPVLFYRVPADGIYEVETRDSIYRGREDFVYRIAVGEQPFITAMFPLGGRAGVVTVASINGWNLHEKRLPLDTQPGAGCIRQTALHHDGQTSNCVTYAVDTLPECNETEINDTAKDAQQIVLPTIINGRIARPGDTDVFRFEGRAGDEVVAEVCSRRLNSPLDSLLRLTDASGRVLEWNDDHVLEDNHLYKDTVGLLTHHADSYLMADLPKNGTYYVHLADSQHHGGEAYGYRLRIAAPQPDFALRITPSSIGVGAGGIVPVCVHALRKDGFDGGIEVVLKEPGAGFELNGGRVPAGRDRVRMTLTAPFTAPDQPVALRLEGRARIRDRTVSHLAVPADDVMQAFLYRHLVPRQELLVSVQKARWRVPSTQLAGDGPVRIPAGGSARVLIKTRRTPMLEEMRLELNEPPEGVTLHDVSVVPGGLAFQLKADTDASQAGFADNLIVEAFREFTPRQENGKPANQRRRSSMGFLPAIPIEIVQP